MHTYIFFKLIRFSSLGSERPVCFWFVDYSEPRPKDQWWWCLDLECCKLAFESDTRGEDKKATDRKLLHLWSDFSSSPLEDIVWPDGNIKYGSTNAITRPARRNVTKTEVNCLPSSVMENVRGRHHYGVCLPIDIEGERNHCVWVINWIGHGIKTLCRFSIPMNRGSGSGARARAGKRNIYPLNRFAFGVSVSVSVHRICRSIASGRASEGSKQRKGGSTHSLPKWIC